MKRFESIFSNMNEENKTVKQMLYDYVCTLFDIANNDPENAKFLYSLVFDQHSEVQNRRKSEQKLYGFC